MLTFVGLGLYDERSITVEGRDAIADADRAFAERYTSILAGASVSDLEAAHDTTIEVRDRAGVESDPGAILDAADAGTAALLIGGDAMVSTTHVDLRLRAHDREIKTRIVHGTTAQAAASSLTGLQNYRFGKATTLPFAYGSGDGDGNVPESVVETISENRERGLHTLVYLDIDAESESYMTASQAAGRLADSRGDMPGEDALGDDTLGVAVARAGSPEPVVAADRLSELAERSFGDPLHLLVIPGNVHHLEAEALSIFAGGPDEFRPE